MAGKIPVPEKSSCNARIHQLAVIRVNPSTDEAWAWMPGTAILYGLPLRVYGRNDRKKNAGFFRYRMPDKGFIVNGVNLARDVIPGCVVPGLM